MIKNIANLSCVVLLMNVFSTYSYAKKKGSINKGFVQLFNGENWDGWYLKLRNGDGELAKKVYDIKDGLVHVFKDFPDTFALGTGANVTHGLFYTKKKFIYY